MEVQTETYLHKRPGIARRKGCLHGGEDCRSQFTAQPGLVHCPRCKTSLIRPNHGRRITNAMIRRKRRPRS